MRANVSSQDLIYIIQMVKLISACPFPQLFIQWDAVGVHVLQVLVFILTSLALFCRTFLELLLL